MKSSSTSWFVVIGVSVVWQLVVIGLVAAGIFVSLYELFGIPWNATGLTNIAGTTLGLVLLELPILILAGLIFLRRRKS